MRRTLKQEQGDFGETEAIAEDIGDEYDIKIEKKNNKGYDYKRKKRNYNQIGGIA